MFKKRNIIIFAFAIFAIITICLIYFNFFRASSNDFSPCEDPQQGDIRKCYRELGRERQDVNFCNKINKKVGEWEMRDSCILGVAESTRDYKICEESNERDGCLSVLIIDRITQDPKLCESMSNNPISFKDDCYKTLGIDLNNSELCSKVKNLDGRNVCFFWVAQNTKDSSVCEEIEDNPDIGDQRSYCLNELNGNSP